ncbi:TPA-induced transmembrane protein-like [Sceloporus undulatus]|uniref:TPA-induced transmembrane protein-like n=1 Tax=Sceloporus undulatus TaxID=8520 RepID=UPI001C4B2373|nr:TPA-induced transmembrane protein-like [Sceloporus undulatus]XP_042298931.1 TPA-induced transmembrane protein-like [Sceloporus undulatus]XP_042298932.1 TPA-induced transmembrane protein-like [Sceloporus undulatus]XP_042298933.1 TPA-induced transmembrane protein-like [Sceloporus undulatus]XP_042298934.1 TPA-induced transmembrane protein-like [Sceloporus undulatus]
MNGHVPQQEDAQDIPLQQVGEERSGDDVPESNELLQPNIFQPNKKKALLKSCSEIVFWKCRLWMLVTSIFLLLIAVTIITLSVSSAVYIDEDEYWDPELIASGNHHNFSGIVKIHCVNPELLLSESTYNLLSENLHKRLLDVYRDSPALGRYFISAEVISISDGNNTAAYHLCFSVPQDETREFMKYRMNQNFVMNILRQNIYDQEELYGLDVPECINLTLDPTSLSLTQIQPINTEG